jgi:hypothetical protein
MIDYKKMIIPIIKWLSIDLNEVFIDIKLSDKISYDTIEWSKEKNKVFLHRIESDLDIVYDFDLLKIDFRKKIYYHLLKHLNCVSILIFLL